jgi:cephalosporin-C deacetylase
MRFFEITHWDEIDVWFAKNPDQTWQSMLKTFSYFDTKNMANWIKCPVIMGIGLQDEICPPSTSFATYNYIESKKQYSVYKNAKHYQPKSHYENRFKFLRESFKMDRVKN